MKCAATVVESDLMACREPGLMSSPVWTADIELHQPLAQQLIRAQFPELRACIAEPFASGWDNAAYLVDGKIVFRFPRRRVAARLIERECRILPSLADQLAVRISAPRYVGNPSPGYPWSFAGYDLIDGATACSVDLSADARSALARPLAAFLRSLHRIDPLPLVARGLPADEIGRLEPAKRLRLTLERQSSLPASDLTQSIQLGVDWLKAHPPDAVDERSRTLVHGDLYARHVLLDADARLTGVIDWGDIHLGDPALDLAIAFLMLPPGAHAAFRAGYGPIDERTWNAARYRAIYHAILEFDYGLRVNDAGMFRIGATALRFSTASLA